MKIVLAFICLTFLVSACNDVETVIGRDKKAKKISYSYTCLDSTLSGRQSNRRIEKAEDLIRDLAIPEKSITDSVQNSYGDLFHEEMINEGAFKLYTDAPTLQKLNTALQKLLATRENPSAIRYSIYALEDTMINAFTFGGHIYITRAMLDKCSANESLLFAIIGHEIGHSEEGHIKSTIQELVLSQKVFGEQNGNIIFELKKLLTASFNQKNELEADYYGINLTNALGYDVCAAVNFWKEMASKENSYTEVEDFFRTHPFSNLRAECLSNHIHTNFNKDCGKLNEAATLPQLVNEK